MTEMQPSPVLDPPLRGPDLDRPDYEPAPDESGLGIIELAPQITRAARAYERWQRARAQPGDLESLAAGPEATLHRAIEILAVANEDASQELLESLVLDAEAKPSRRAVAGLALLRRDERRGLGLIDSLVTDASGPSALRELIVLWRQPETDWRLTQRARRAGPGARSFWLELLDARRVALPDDLIESIAEHDDPEGLAWALRLAKYADEPAAWIGLARDHFHDMNDPALRCAAIELAVFCGDPVAWILCRQMASTRNYPRAVELLASFGSARELEPLWRSGVTASGVGLWRLCRSGRKPAATLAARRLEREPDDHFAASGLRFIVGVDETAEAETIDELLERWASLAPTLADDARYIYGQRPKGGAELARCLASSDDLHHEALGDEISFRSRGAQRWMGRGFATDMLAHIRALDLRALDFDAELAAPLTEASTRRQ